MLVLWKMEHDGMDADPGLDRQTSSAVGNALEWQQLPCLGVLGVLPS